MAVTAQYEKNGVVEEILLDIMPVAQRHTGHNLAVEFTKVLQEFGIMEKVSHLFPFMVDGTHSDRPRSSQ
jgi:hypothetical protein